MDDAIDTSGDSGGDTVTTDNGLTLANTLGGFFNGSTLTGVANIINAAKGNKNNVPALGFGNGIPQSVVVAPPAAAGVSTTTLIAFAVVAMLLFFVAER